MSNKPLIQKFALGTVRPGMPALGRVMARPDMRSFPERFPVSLTDEVVVLLDFETIPDTNSSFVERTYFWAADAGRAFAGEDERALLYLPGTEDAIIPAPVFPIAVNCSPSVVEEIEAAASKTRRVAAVAIKPGEPLRVRLIGELERSLRETLDRLCHSEGLTAADLHELTQRRGTSGARDVGVNVWHNRLAALYRLRLAWRAKDGRQWRYFSIASEVTHG